MTPPSSLACLTEQVNGMVTTWQSQAALNLRLTEVVTELHAELAEIRDSIIDLDHGKASVDALASHRQLCTDRHVLAMASRDH